MINAHNYNLIIDFTEIGYYCTTVNIIQGQKLLNTTYIREADVQEIKNTIKNLLDAFLIDQDNVEYVCSQEIMNIITRKTLCGEKTVWELFKEQNIEIKIDEVVE